MRLDSLGIACCANEEGVFGYSWGSKRVVCAAGCKYEMIIGQSELVWYGLARLRDRG